MNGQGKQVRILYGTAAVCVELIIVDENQSLGNPEKADDQVKNEYSKMRVRRPTNMYTTDA